MAKYDKIELSSLFLDTENPRLSKSLQRLDEVDIVDYMLLQAVTLELMQAIGENGFFEGEQLLVVEISKNKYKVVEGNRRLISLKLLQNPEIARVKKLQVKKVYEEAKFRPTKIPCLIFTDESAIRKYLGYRHITGIKPWGLSEKARFLNRLKNEQFKEEGSLDRICRELAKIIGSRRDYVKRLLIAYSIYEIIEDESFYNIKDLDDTTFYVGYVSDSLSRSKIAAFLGVDMSSSFPLERINKKHLKEWVHWFYEKNDQNKTRIKGKSKDLNELNKVIGNELALKEFRNGASLKYAHELAENIDDIFQNSVNRANENIELADRMVHKVKSFYSGIEDELDNIRRVALKIKRTKEDIEDEQI